MKYSLQNNILGIQDNKSSSLSLLEKWINDHHDPYIFGIRPTKKTTNFFRLIYNKTT